MSININDVIFGVEKNLQDNIDAQQQQLDHIKNAYEQAEQFLLTGEYSELSEKEDILKEVMKSIKNTKGLIKTNEADISHIINSINALKKVSTGVEGGITNQLQKNIDNIKSVNKEHNDKLKNANLFLEPLLSLELICPSCGNGSNNEVSNCHCCGGLGIVNVATVLKQENLLEVEFNTNVYPTENIYQNQQYSSYLNESIGYTDQSKSEKYIISKK